jgi:F-type H+-transporting ATPase subunit delta
MKNRKLASRYAQALLDALAEPPAQEQADRFLTGLAEAMQASTELRDLLLDPAVPRSSRAKALGILAEQQGAPALMMKNFLATVVDHGRTADLPEIAEVFHELREKSLGIVAATLTTAAPIDPSLQSRAQQALESLTGQRVNLEFNVEPSLIGGAVAQVGSQVFDGSLRTQLGRMRRKMVQE